MVQIKSRGKFVHVTMRPCVMAGDFSVLEYVQDIQPYQRSMDFYRGMEVKMSYETEFMKEFESGSRPS